MQQPVYVVADDAQSVRRELARQQAAWTVERTKLWAELNSQQQQFAEELAKVKVGV